MLPISRGGRPCGLDFLSVSPRLERKVTFPTVRRQDQDPLVQWTCMGHSLWGVPGLLLPHTSNKSR